MLIFQKNKFGENCKGHNRQLIATVLPLFFAIKTVFPKSQKHKNFRQQGNFRQQKNEGNNLGSKEL